MSLNESLAYNRRIFEQLTGSGGMADADPAGQSPARVARIVTGWERGGSAEVSRGYSLWQESPRETGMALSFEPPAEMEYPAVGESKAAAWHTDPAESLYMQLEAEARRSSQLSCEEEF